MPDQENPLEDLKQRTKRLSQDIKNEARGFLGHKTKRERISVSKKITIDPFSFLIGGIGAVAVGVVTDDSLHYFDEHIARENEGVVSAAFRTLAYPIRTAVRFCAGGCIYTVLDAFVLHALDHRAPYITGALTASLFAVGTRPSVFVGSILGMALFAQIADLMFDIYINK